MALDLVLIESRLEDFIIFDILVLVLCSPSNFIECESAGVEAVKDCAVDCTSGTLLNLCELQLKKEIS